VQQGIAEQVGWLTAALAADQLRTAYRNQFLCKQIGAGGIGPDRVIEVNRGIERRFRKTERFLARGDIDGDFRMQGMNS